MKSGKTPHSLHIELTAMATNDNETSSPGAKLREKIIRQVLKFARDNSDLNEDQQLAEVETIITPLFEQFGSESEQKPKSRPRSKRKIRHDRKDHVGRFFLRVMEKQLREANIQECLIPVFANSVQDLIGDEPYSQLTEKINRLLEFAEKKGFDYDQTLDSKPGKGIAGEIMELYRSEADSAAFEKKIKNRLDETLVKHNVLGPDEEPLDIEVTIDTAFSEFIRLVNPGQAPAEKA